MVFVAKLLHSDDWSQLNFTPVHSPVACSALEWWVHIFLTFNNNSDWQKFTFYVGENDNQGRRRMGACRMHSPLPFQKGGNGDEGAFSQLSLQFHGLSKSAWNKFIAAIRALRKFKMVVYNFCYFWGQHCCCKHNWLRVFVFVRVSIDHNSYCPTATTASLAITWWFGDFRRKVPHHTLMVSYWRNLEVRTNYFDFSLPSNSVWRLSQSRNFG